MHCYLEYIIWLNELKFVFICLFIGNKEEVSEGLLDKSCSINLEICDLLSDGQSI